MDVVSGPRRSRTGVRWRSSLWARRTPLTRAASGGCSARDAGGASGSASVDSFGVDAVADDHNVEDSSARSKSSPADASAASKTATAAAANTGRRSGRVSSPTRAKLVPQYSQCSYTDAKAPPSNTRGSVASTNSTYFEILCVAQLYKSALPSRLASPSASSEKIALYCITRSNSATRCVSVSFFR